MPIPSLEVVSVGNNCYTINDRGRTVALISSQGYIDWLLRTPEQDGPLYTKIEKETHLCYVLGFKIMLTTPAPHTEMREFTYRVEDGGTRVVLTGKGVTADGAFTSFTTATLAVDPATREYAWAMETTVGCSAPEAATLNGIEYNNVYPHGTGRCMLFTPYKRYSLTLMADQDGTVWRFPHQHMMHYGTKTPALTFGSNSWAGFFGEPAPNGCPIVQVKESTLPLDWGICDMYYDLHCSARISGMVQPGDEWRFVYDVRYCDDARAKELAEAAKPIPVSVNDWETHDYARFELGMNNFTHGMNIDRPDDASGFRPSPPQKVWDRQVGHRTKGSLRITNLTAQETIWSPDPPSQIPADTRLNITAMVKTQGVTGKGISIRVRYHSYFWHPTPHIEWPITLESNAVTGTSDGWVQIALPELRVPKEHFDYLIWLDVVLDGEGVAWLTDMDVDLQYETAAPPVLQEGGKDAKSKFRVRTRAHTGSGTSL